jgi:hypothetical protein
MSEKNRDNYERSVLKHRSRKALLRRNQPGSPKDGHYESDTIQRGWETWTETVEQKPC